MGEIRIILPQWPEMAIYCDSPEEAIVFVDLMTEDDEREITEAERKRERRRQYWRNMQYVSRWRRRFDKAHNHGGSLA